MISPVAIRKGAFSNTNYVDTIILPDINLICIIGRKDFYTVYEEPSMRINELLSIFELNDRLLSDVSQYKQFKCINYNEDIIQNIVKRSKNLLIKNLGGECSNDY